MLLRPVRSVASLRLSKVMIPPCPSGTNDPVFQAQLLQYRLAQTQAAQTQAQASAKDEFRAKAEAAHAKYASFIQETPLLPFDDLCTPTQRVWVKCENLQRTGSFKARGAMAACQALLEANPEAKTVVTHSSGNFAQALSWAAGQLGLTAEIVMPRNAPATKVAGVRKWKGNITFCESTQEAREAAAAHIVASTGGEFMHPYNDERVILGQASIAVEFEKQLQILTSACGGSGSGSRSYDGSSVVAIVLNYLF